MKILVFDNYDSFTYNLVHIIAKEPNVKVDVYRNDEISLEQVAAYDKIMLSPGPGIPQEAGLLLPLIKAYATTKSILGVCLGHQAIAEAFGGELINLEQVYHGIATNCNIIKEDYLFNNIDKQIMVGRYHSWVVNQHNLPEQIIVTATDDDGYIMALQHETYDVRGVQFHPESVLTPQGEKIILNWLYY